MLLKRIAETDEKAVGFQSVVVTLVEVKKTKAIAAKQIEIAILHIGAQHNV